MSLDVHVRNILDQMAALKLPKLSEIGPQAARAAMRASIFRGGDAPIGKSEDRRIPGPAHDIGLRVYTPVGAGFFKSLCIFLRLFNHQVNVNALKSLRPVFGETALADITPESIEDYLTERLQSRRRIRTKLGIKLGDVIKPATAHQELRVLTHILNVAVKQKRLATNPCVAVEFPVQGVGAAILAPSTLALLSTSFPEGRQRTRAMAAYGALAGIGRAAS